MSSIAEPEVLDHCTALACEENSDWVELGTARADSWQPTTRTPRDGIRWIVSRALEEWSEQRLWELFNTVQKIGKSGRRWVDCGASLTPEELDQAIDYTILIDFLLRKHDHSESHRTPLLRSLDRLARLTADFMNGLPGPIAIAVKDELQLMHQLEEEQKTQSGVTDGVFQDPYGPCLSCM